MIKPNAPIILTGNQRSSTTFLATMLKKHPNGSFGTEDGVIRMAILWFYQFKSCPELLRYGRFNEFIQLLRIRTKDHHLYNKRIMKELIREMYDDRSLENLITQQNVENFIRQICYRFYLKKAKTNTPKFWGDKYPEYVMQLDQIREIFPQAKYLYLIRHPYTNIEAIYRKTAAAQKQMGRLIHDLEDCVIQYKRWHQKWQKFKLEDINYLELKFEDLIADPDSYIQSIESFLDIKLTGRKFVEQMKKNLDKSKSIYSFNTPIYQSIAQLVQEHSMDSFFSQYNYKL